MRIEWASFVQAVSGPGTSPTLHGVGMDGATVSHLPIVIPLTVMARTATPPHELGQEACIGVEVADPELVIVHSTDGVTTPEAPETAFPGWEIRHWSPVQIRLRAEQEGVYTVRLRLDGELAWELPFRVRLAE